MGEPRRACASLGMSAEKAEMGPTTITGPGPDGISWLTGHRVWVRFSTSSTSIVTALFSGPVRFGGVTTVAFSRFIRPGAGAARAARQAVRANRVRIAFSIGTLLIGSATFPLAGAAGGNDWGWKHYTQTSILF